MKRMPSGAGHDAGLIAAICPTAMIFVPSVDGVSHNVREYTPIEDLERGTNILLQTLLGDLVNLYTGESGRLPGATAAGKGPRTAKVLWRITGNVDVAETDAELH